MTHLLFRRGGHDPPPYPEYCYISNTYLTPSLILFVINDAILILKHMKCIRLTSHSPLLRLIMDPPLSVVCVKMQVWFQNARAKFRRTLHKQQQQQLIHHQLPHHSVPIPPPHFHHINSVTSPGSLSHPCTTAANTVSPITSDDARSSNFILYPPSHTHTLTSSVSQQHFL